MCGICGLTGDFVDPEILNRMEEAMIHRGPDGFGRYVGEGCALGMRRLSIIDVSGGRQPFASEDGRYRMVYNGELYNYLDLRNDLINRGRRFQTETDGEAILHLFEEKGAECLEQLNGMFAFAIWDEAEKTLFIARDRLGIKPLYWLTNGNGAFAFASEVKSLLASGLSDRRIDLESISDYLAFPAFVTPKTIISDIKALPPGHFLLRRNGSISIRPYWKITVPEKRVSKTSDLLEQLRDSVSMRLMSERPLGVLLSGGLDSAILTALVRQIDRVPLKTFTIRFRVDDAKADQYDEGPYAEETARILGSEHHEETLCGADVRKELETIISLADQPSGDLMNVYFAGRLAARHVTVALSGTGGDELFAGYPWFLDAVGPLRKNRPASALAKIIGALTGGFINHGFQRRLDAWSGSGTPIDRYRTIRTLFYPAERSVLFSDSVRGELGDYVRRPNPTLLEAASRLDGFPPAKQLSALHLQFDMPNLLLRDTDTMTMCHSLEARVPFLDHRFVEFALGFPGEELIRNGRLKFPLYQAAKEILPETIINRPKRGFIFPLDLWLKDELREPIGDLLSEETVRRRGLFKPESVNKVWREFYGGRAKYHRLWNLAVLEFWLQKHIDA